MATTFVTQKNVVQKVVSMVSYYSLLNLTLLLVKACIPGIEGSTTSDGSTDTGMEVSLSVNITMLTLTLSLSLSPYQVLSDTSHS